jgi:hypothetical protein
MIYSVKYRKCGKFFWNKIKVKGDLTMVADGLQVRVFILENDERLEIPALSYEFWYSKERHMSILKNMEKESGQKIPVGS